MTNFRNVAFSLVAGAAMLAIAAPSFAKAETARFSKAPIYTGTPALQTTVDMITAGTGTAGFDSTKLVGVLAGAKTSAEVASLSTKFGADNVKSFLEVFNFVVDDSVKIVTAAKVPLPKASTPAPDGKALAISLYTLGVTPDKSFDVEYMLDALVTHPVHVQVMKDIDAKYGEKADANYHAVLTQAMNDLKSVYAP
jgi:hypothetical protein